MITRDAGFPTTMTMARCGEKGWGWVWSQRIRQDESNPLLLEGEIM